MQIFNNTYFRIAVISPTSHISQLYLLKAKFLANYCFKFAIVGKLNYSAFMQSVYNPDYLSFYLLEFLFQPYLGVRVIWKAEKDNSR
jgi:hypothetical protein